MNFPHTRKNTSYGFEQLPALRVARVLLYVVAAILLVLCAAGRGAIFALLFVMVAGVIVAISRPRTGSEAPQAPAREQDAWPSQSAQAASGADAVAERDAGTPSGNSLPHAKHDAPVLPDESSSGALRATHEAGQEATGAPQSTLASTSHAGADAKSQFDYDALLGRLLGSPDPFAELRIYVSDIRSREEHGGGAGILRPSDVELFAARQLEEAGLFEKQPQLPHVRAIRSPHSRMIYLRMENGSIPYTSYLRVLKIEAALNALRFIAEACDDLSGIPQVDCYRLIQSLTTSICAQSPAIDQPIELDEGEEPDGEWTVRRGIATAIESMQLPYRLETRYRVNVAAGNVAFQVDLTPEKVFPSSFMVDGLGIVKSSREMRRKAASAYAQRLAILLAATAFRTSERIKHVWVIGTVDNAHTHRCYFCIDFDRWRFSRLDLARISNLPKVMRSFVPNMRLENDILRPVAQTADLNEPRFSPPWRHTPVGLVTRKLSGNLARALGTGTVSGLAIEEADKRSLIAADIMLNLVPASAPNATEKNVGYVLEHAGDDPDPTVRAAAERVARAMIEGSLDSNPEEIGEAFVSGDALTQASARARELLAHRDAEGVVATLASLVADIDGSGTFDDAGGVVWRYFSNYVDRALYNREHENDGKALLLIPDAYFAAHYYLSIAYLMLDQGERALAHARRLAAMAPLDKHAALQLVRCLEENERADEAVETLDGFLRGAHDPEAVGLGYYQMASFQWKKGNIMAAQACYQQAMNYLPGITPLVVMEVSGLLGASQQQGGPAETSLKPLSPDEIATTLGYHDIPLAPTDDMSRTFLECARASVDAEIYPVAKNFVGILAAFDPDDVIMDVMGSMEGVPDT